MSSSHAVKITWRPTHLNPGLTLTPSGLHIFAPLGPHSSNDCECVFEREEGGGRGRGGVERISFPPSEPGRAVSKRVLIDFEVVAVGNASHR